MPTSRDDVRFRGKTGSRRGQTFRMTRMTHNAHSRWHTNLYSISACSVGDTAIRIHRKTSTYASFKKLRILGRHCSKCRAEGRDEQGSRPEIVEVVEGGLHFYFSCLYRIETCVCPQFSKCFNPRGFDARLARGRVTHCDHL